MNQTGLLENRADYLEQKGLGTSAELDAGLDQLEREERVLVRVHIQPVAQVANLRDVIDPAAKVVVCNPSN